MSQADISKGTNNVLAQLFVPLLISSGRMPTTSKAQLWKLQANEIHDSQSVALDGKAKVCYLQKKIYKG